jgi:hypothetical protein
MEGDMDSITKVDGMEGVRLVFFPGSVRVVLDDDALTMIAEGLEWKAEAMRRMAETYEQYGGPYRDVRDAARRCELLAEVVREAEGGSMELGTGAHVEGRNPERAAALVEALDEAGAQS